MSGGPDTRIARAAAALNAQVGELDDLVCDFVGQLRPAGQAGRSLLRRVFERLDAVAPDVLRTICDLSDAADLNDIRAEHIPPIPEPLIEAVAYVDVIISRLAPAELQTAALQLGVSRHTAIGACFTVAPWRSPVPPNADRLPTLADLADDPQPARWTAAFVDALAERDPTTWSSAEATVVRMTLRQHLARTGDGLLRLSEWHAPTADWHETEPGVQTALWPVHAAPTPLEARVRPADPAQQRLATTTELFAPRSIRPIRSYRWDVGWRDNTGTFYSHEGQVERSPAAARFGAAVTLARMAAHSESLRQRWTRELFIPRTGSYNRDAITIDLRDMLLATMNEHRGTNAPIGWRTRPHSTADGDLGSVAALLFDNLSLPCPRPVDPACDADIDSPEFTAFLTRHAVILSPLAIRYLAGMSDAGPDECSLGDRHAAGLRAVILNETNDTPIALELAPSPDHHYAALINIELLEPYFAATTGQYDS